MRAPDSNEEQDQRQRGEEVLPKPQFHMTPTPPSLKRPQLLSRIWLIKLFSNYCQFISKTNLCKTWKMQLQQLCFLLRWCLWLLPAFGKVIKMLIEIFQYMSSTDAYHKVDEDLCDNNKVRPALHCLSQVPPVCISSTSLVLKNVFVFVNVLPSAHLMN